MKRWYVAQVFSGFEEQIKVDIERQVEQSKLQDEVGRVLIPSAKLKTYFSSVDTEDQQLFPGYILIELELTDRVKKMISATPRLMRFLGGKDPVPLSSSEIEKVFARMEGEVVVASSEVQFSVGQEVEITQGPFTGFIGIVEEVDGESERLKVVVSILGRMTPVELNFDQVQ